MIYTLIFLRSSSLGNLFRKNSNTSLKVALSAKVNHTGKTLLFMLRTEVSDQYKLG